MPSLILSPKHVTLGDSEPHRWTSSLHLKSKCHPSISEQGGGSEYRERPLGQANPGSLGFPWTGSLGGNSGDWDTDRDLLCNKDGELRCGTTASWVLIPTGFSQHLSRLLDSKIVHAS